MALATGNIPIEAFQSGLTWTATAEGWDSPEHFNGESYFSIGAFPDDVYEASGPFLHVRLVYKRTDHNNDISACTCTIVDAGGTALTSTFALNDGGMDAGFVAFDSDVALTAAGLAADKTVWEGARFWLSGTHSVSMGSDNSWWTIRLAGTWVSLDYTGEPSVALDTADAIILDASDPRLLLTGSEGSGRLVYDLQIAKNNAFMGEQQTEYQTNSKACWEFTGYYQVFEAKHTAPILGVKLRLWYGGVADGSFFARLRNVAGSLATGKPSTLQRAATPTIATSSISGTNEIVTLMFFTPYVPYVGELLAIHWYTNATAGRPVYIGYNANGDYHEGAAGLGTGASSWTYQAGDTLWFEMIQDELISEHNSEGNPDWSSANGEPYIQGEQVTFTIPDNLTHLDVYYWRVRVVDPDGSNIISPWSASRSFTWEVPITDLLLISTITGQSVLSDAAAYLDYYGSIASAMNVRLALTNATAYMELGTASLISPVDGAPAVVAPVLLVWTQYFEATAYRVQISTTADFLNIIEDTIVEGTSITFNTALATTQYFWRVKAIVPSNPRI
jgi:hypothetical protein